MKLIIFILTFCFLMCSTHKKSTRDQQEPKVFSTLNEKWSNNESSDLIIVPDTTSEWFNKFHNGTDCIFFEDGTFEIIIWWYGVSSGLFRSLIKGGYKYDAEKKVIELNINENLVRGITQTSEGKPYPTTYFLMEGLKIKNKLYMNYIQDIPILSKPSMKIVEETTDRIKIDLYAYDEKGKLVSFGQQNYVRVKLESVQVSQDLQNF